MGAGPSCDQTEESDMRVKTFTTRALAVLVGTVVFLLSLFLMAVGQSLITEYALQAPATQHWPYAASNWGLVPGWAPVGRVVQWVYPACAGFIAVALFWRGWPAAWG